MKAFRFRLQTLLELREREEDAAKKELSNAQHQLFILEEELQTFFGEQEKVADELRRMQASPVGVLDLRNTQEYHALLQDRIAQKQDEIMRQRNVVHAKQELLARAMQERKTIEKLKEKQYAAWKREVDRQEAAFLDELGTTRYHAEGGTHCE